MNIFMMWLAAMVLLFGAYRTSVPEMALAASFIALGALGMSVMGM